MGEDGLQLAIYDGKQHERKKQPINEASKASRKEGRRKGSKEGRKETRKGRREGRRHAQ